MRATYAVSPFVDAGETHVLNGFFEKTTPRLTSSKSM